MAQGQFAEAEQLIPEQLASNEKVGELSSSPRRMRNLGVTLLLLGQFDEGAAHVDQSEAMYLDLGNHNSITFVKTWQSFARLHLGDYQQAKAFAEDGIILAEKWANGHQGTLGNARWLLGCISLAQGDYKAAANNLPRLIPA